MSKSMIDKADEAPASSSPSKGGSEGDVKIMAEVKGDRLEKDIDAGHNTDTPMVPGNFHEFTGSQAKMYTTYENRQEKIAQALGSKSPLVS